MSDNGEALHGGSAQLCFGVYANRNAVTPTPERGAIERIKRKATAMASAAAAELSAGVPEAPRDRASGSAAPPLARTCRCADAEVRAYRDGAEWWCHTCGYELSARVSGQLSIGARPGRPQIAVVRRDSGMVRAQRAYPRASGWVSTASDAGGGRGGKRG
jgi:hypothetical protein